MGDRPSEASRWRIELAQELIRYYAPRDGIRMAVLSGSPPKGLSDEYSDLDVIVFWDVIDVRWLESNPLGGVQCERKYFRRMGGADVYLESYYFDELKVDFGHLTMAVWSETVDGVLGRHEADPSALGSIAGFLTSVPLYGAGAVEEWKRRLEQYPDELALKVVRSHRRFFVPGYLLNQAYRRGDVLAYYDGLCLMLKNLLDILAALNRMYFSTEEPRWIEYSLEAMTVKPEDAWGRIRRALTSDPEDGVDILEGLTDDVLALIEKHMPALADGYPDRRRAMTVRGRRAKPEVRPREGAA